MLLQIFTAKINTRISKFSSLSEELSSNEAESEGDTRVNATRTSWSYKLFTCNQDEQLNTILARNLLTSFIALKRKKLSLQNWLCCFSIFNEWGTMESNFSQFFLFKFSFFSSFLIRFYSLIIINEIKPAALQLICQYQLSEKQKRSHLPPNKQLGSSNLFYQTCKALRRSLSECCHRALAASYARRRREIYARQVKVNKTLSRTCFANWSFLSKK